MSKAISCAGLTQRFALPKGVPWWRLLFAPAESIPSVTVLEDVSLGVGKGRFLGVIGRNGAGKSTLLRVLAGVLEPSSGSVSRQGTRTGIFELGGLGNRFLSGRDYSRRFLVLNGVGGRRAERMLPGVQEFSELGAKFDDALITYSSGMLARLYFSVATSIQSDIYLIDELLSVGDEHFQAKCWQRLRELRARGASGVLVTHDWSAVLRVCHEACILERGRIVRRGVPEDVIQSYLKLPPPQAGVATFVAGPRAPSPFRSDVGGDIVLEVELRDDVPVAVGYSVEAIGGQIGWEALLIRNFSPVADKAGRYEVRVHISPGLLAPGRYLLNLFLTSPRETYGRDLKVYDTRSWTVGRPEELIVEGAAAAGVTGLRFSWEEVAA